MPIYLHEITKIRPGKIDDWLKAVEERFLPLGDRYGMRLVGFWETVHSQGWFPETVAVWELDDFAHYVRVLRAEHSGEAEHRGIRQWHRDKYEWITGGEGLVCFKSALTPTVAEIRERKVKAQLCTHEMVYTAPARQAEYLELLEEMWWNRVAKRYGRSLIGLYWSPWKNTRAINIWGQGDDWDRVLSGGQEGDMITDRNTKIWQTLGREVRTDWDDRFLVPAPFSTIR